MACEKLAQTGKTLRPNISTVEEPTRGQRQAFKGRQNRKHVQSKACALIQHESFEGGEKWQVSPLNSRKTLAHTAGRACILWQCNARKLQQAKTIENFCSWCLFAPRALPFTTALQVKLVAATKCTTLGQGCSCTPSSNWRLCESSLIPDSMWTPRIVGLFHQLLGQCIIHPDR